MNNNNRTAIYVRLSKEDLNSGERESESIQNQKSMLIDYAARNRWAVYNIYCDEDYSGAYSGVENTRPEFNKMIDDARQNLKEVKMRGFPKYTDISTKYDVENLKVFE